MSSSPSGGRPYLDHVDGLVDGTLSEVDLAAAGSGFGWYEMAKLEHEMLSVRHLQHHTGQLADRLRTHAGVGLDWKA